MKLTWHHWVIYAALTAALLWLRENWLLEPGRTMPGWIFAPAAIAVVGLGAALAKLNLDTWFRRVRWRFTVLWAGGLVSLIWGTWAGYTNWQNRTAVRMAEERRLAEELRAPFPWWRWQELGGLPAMMLDGMIDGYEGFPALVNVWEKEGRITDLQTDIKRQAEFLFLDRDPWETLPVAKERHWRHTVVEHFYLFRRLYEPRSENRKLRASYEGFHDYLYWILSTGRDPDSPTSWAACEKASKEEWEAHKLDSLPLERRKQWERDACDKLYEKCKAKILALREDRARLESRWQSAWEKMTPEERKAMRQEQKSLTFSVVERLTKGILGEAAEQK